MKAKRGMIALVTEFKRDYSRKGSGISGDPVTEHLIGIVESVKRDGTVKTVKTVKVIGMAKTYEFPARYGSYKLVGITDAVDPAAIPAIEAIQNPGNAKTWRMWESETEAVEFLKRFKK